MTSPTPAASERRLQRLTAGRLRGAAPLLGAVLISACLVACRTTTVGTPAPSTPAQLGIDWGRVASVQRPANYEETVAPSYVAMHPILRIQGQAMMVDLAALPGRGYVAVGYVPPDWVPYSWTSPDAQSWTIHQIDATPFTFPVSVAVGADGTIVAVGRSGNDPVSWTSHDGTTWTEHTAPILSGSSVAERMTSVVATASGFVAGGSSGPELLDRHARFWTSPDGATWQAVPDDATAFANAEVRGITSFSGGLVAVGVVGGVQDPTGAVAWTSSDGSTWTRIDSAAFANGEAVSVAPGPAGGLVAVGADIGRRNAVAWITPDGKTWTRAPDEASREHSGGFAWMTDVVTVDGVAIGVGDVQGLQRGTAVSWISRDGLTWQQSASAPVQSGAEFYGITTAGHGALVVGAFGIPDSYVPEVWLTPAH
jgi:hypothetical protein